MKKKKIKNVLNILPFGDADPMAVMVIAGHLQTVLGINADILPPQNLPSQALLKRRKQYDAAKIIGQMAQNSVGNLQLGVVASDLCTPILTYIFGESQLGGHAAVISLFRLAHHDQEVLFTRAAKISLHEVGHLIGIGHCWQNFCLMRFASSLEMLDALPVAFCSACEYEIGRRLKSL